MTTAEDVVVDFGVGVVDGVLNCRESDDEVVLFSANHLSQDSLDHTDNLSGFPWIERIGMGRGESA